MTDCANCNDHPGDVRTLQLEGRAGKKRLEIALCEPCLRELSEEDWIDVVE